MGASRYYLVEDEALVAKARAFRQAYIDQSEKFWDFVKQIGGTGYQVGFADQLLGIVFPWGKHPEGFKKPKCGGVATYPMKKSDWQEKMSALGRLPQIFDFFPELSETPCWINYEGPTSKGGSRIGDALRPVQLCWYGATSPFLMVLPDVERAIQVVKIGHPDATLRNDIEAWRPPEGVREIIVEEWDFMVAKYNKEKAA